MMFKDVYRRKNDAVHAREGLLDEIRTAHAVQSRGERQKTNRRRQWLIAIPTVAVAAAACVAVVIGINAGGKKNYASEVKSAEAGYTSMLDASEAYVQMQAEAPVAVESYEELGKIMEARGEKRGLGIYKNSDAAAEAAPTEAEEPAAVQSDTVMMKGENGILTADASGRSYTGTNIQVEGVDEADIVKTDGTWIYTLNQANNKVYILSAEGKETAVVGTIKLKTASEKDTYWCYYSEMMLYGDRLYILGTRSDWSDKISDEDRTYTFAEVYDLSDRTAPKHLTSHKQQGEYRAARLCGDLLVIVSDYRIWSWRPLDDGPIMYCPKVVTNDSTSVLEPKEIYVNPNSEENGFTVVTTMNAADGTAFDSHKAVLGGCSTVYCNGADLLVASEEWTSDQSEEQTDANGKHFVKIVSGSNTNLFRFTIENGEIEAAASAKLPGSLLNQFSMDAYNGYYRLVVTRSDSEETIWTDGIDTYEWNNSSNCTLYVLDGDLNPVGQIDDLAKDERVQSVRFMGDVAYFVTFRQVDPLFSADLSDPENPKILSTLKIPGFSAYLHPFGEGKLLGIGFDADEEHGWTENVKLSMYDVSDPANVTEAFKLSLKDVNYTSVQYNHKILFVDVDTQTIAFPADDAYYVFRVENGAFKQIGKIETGEYWYDGARGLFVDDAFYVVGTEKVTVLSFETMKKIASIKLK